MNSVFDCISIIAKKQPGYLIEKKHVIDFYKDI